MVAGIRLILRLYYFLSRPFYKCFYSLIPLKSLAYLTGGIYGRDIRAPGLHLVASVILGTYESVNTGEARRIFRQRISGLPLKKRRRCEKYVWQAGSTLSWGQRAFENTANRCGDYAYRAISNLKGPLSVLELGSLNGGSLRCLFHRGVRISHFCGVDISKMATREARSRFEWAEFHCGDFIDYCNSTNDKFDVLLFKQTLIFIDQSYLEELLSIIGRKEIAKRIVIKERQLFMSDEESVCVDWGLALVNYSHNYEPLFKKAGYTFEDDNRHPHPVKNTLSFEAVMVRQD